MDAVKQEAQERMERALEALERDFGKLRTGRASTRLVDDLKVDYYGAQTPISQLASVSTPDSRTITIQPWDRGSFALVEKAILKSDLGLTPINDGKLIRISIPPLTGERRKELVKVARRYSEEAKVAARNIRREANEALKKLEKDKARGYSEDEIKKAQEAIQKLTDGCVARVDQKCQAKEKEIMEL
ncbi:MAG: ribosome recycling factor [Deltaproteobacteria bacterium]|jgi:ribosome recycling factor|nr:ribosome recycling factor [Deltaproteobacteria bacterium]